MIYDYYNREKFRKRHTTILFNFPHFSYQTIQREVYDFIHGMTHIAYVIIESFMNSTI